MGLENGETAPLLSVEASAPSAEAVYQYQAAGPSAAPAYYYQPPPGYLNSVAPSPPVILTPTGNQSPAPYVINCRVCQLQNTYDPNQKASCISCRQCKEVTPIRSAPAGKKFVICPTCGQLFLAKLSATTATCARSTCKASIVLGPSGPVAAVQVKQARASSGNARSNCAHCDLLLDYSWASAIVTCPKCSRRSVVNRGRLWTWAATFFIAGLIFLGIGVGVTVSTFIEAESSPTGGFYVVMYSPIIIGVVLIARAIIYAVMSCFVPSSPSIV